MSDYHKAIFGMIEKATPKEKKEFDEKGFVGRQMQRRALSMAEKGAMDRLKEINETLKSKPTKGKNILMEERGSIKEALKDLHEEYRPELKLKPITGRKESMHEIAATRATGANEINGQLTIRLEVDQNGRLMTEDKVVEIYKGQIRDTATGRSAP